jgi:hypothetical protein
VSEAVDGEALLETQLSMQPRDLIAQEDYGTACLIAFDLEREITGVVGVSSRDMLAHSSARFRRRDAQHAAPVYAYSQDTTR